MLRQNATECEVCTGLAAGDEAELAGLTGAGAGLDGDIIALLGEVLGSAGMIGNGGDGGAELDVQLAVLGVAAGQAGGIVEHIGDELIHVVRGHVVTSQNDSTHSHGGGVGVLEGGGAAVFLLAAGKQAQGHDKSQKQSKILFHNNSPLF